MTESRAQAGGGPTVQRMLVGSKLRRLRTDMGLSREEAAQAIRASEWKIHRLENGQVGFKERDLVDLLARYGVTDPDEIDELLTMAREANTPGWWRHYGDVLPSWFRTYVDLESAAALIRTYEGQFVPGLLQTDDYMRAVIHGAHLDESSDEVGRRVRLRMARQTLLTREHPPRLWAVVDEAALRRPVGGPGVMKGSWSGCSTPPGCPTSPSRSCPSTPAPTRPWSAPSACCASPTRSSPTSSIWST